MRILVKRHGCGLKSALRTNLIAIVAAEIRSEISLLSYICSNKKLNLAVD